MSTFLAAFTWVLVSRKTINLLVAALFLAAVLAVDMGTTAFNSFFDFWRGTDDADWNRESDKVLVHAHVAPGWALVAGLGCYTAAAIFGLLLAGLSTPWVLLFGTLGMIIGYAYTGGPWPISRSPLGEVFAGGFLGGVLFGLTCFVLGSGLRSQDFLLCFPSTFLVASILTVNNTCDLQGDLATGRRTLSGLLGPELSSLLILAEGGLAWVTLGFFVFSNRPALGWIWGVGFILSLAIYRGMFKRGFSHDTKGPSMRGILSVLALFTLTEILVFIFT
ncbi:MAG: prenyltransferase [Spirochaetales bacterium]|nr:prenyltransferase [Spirochaetales bacterium]